ncbi:hypothetical protein ACFCXR_15390 [Streptomyces noursei]
MNDTVQNPSNDSNYEYVPALMTDLGTITGTTLGDSTNDRADDTEYWD